MAGFLRMGWGGIIAFVVANMVHTSSLQFGIAQMVTTWLASSPTLLLIFVVKRRV